MAEIVQVSFTYNDGDEEDIEDINKQRWRMIYDHSPAPEVHWKVNPKISDAHHILMKKAISMVRSGNGGSTLAVCCRFPVTADHYCSLQDGMWISDTINEAFAKAILKKSVNGRDHRFFLVITRHSTGELGRSKVIAQVSCDG